MYQARQIYIWLNKQCSRSIISFLKIWLRLSPIWFPIEENLWNQKIDIPRRFPKTNNSYIGNAIMSTSCCPNHWFICRESQMKNKTNQMLLAKFLFQLDFFYSADLLSLILKYLSKYWRFVKYEMNIWLKACLACVHKFSLNWWHLCFPFILLIFYFSSLSSFNFHSLSGVYAKFSLNLGHLCQQNKLNCGHLWHKSTKLRWAKELFTTTLLWAFLQTHGS